MNSQRNWIIPIADFKMSADEANYVSQILRSGRLSEGGHVSQFEEEWAAYVGSRHCVVFSSGSTALLAALLAAKQAGHLNGNAILTNPSTYVGTANAILMAGYKVRFADIEPKSFGTMSPDKIRESLELARSAGEQIDAIMPVHLFGIPERLPSITALAKEAGVRIVEDAAQAHGASVADKKLGSWGLFGAFSFYMAHALPGIEMGGVVTNDGDLNNQLRRVKNQGFIHGDTHDEDIFTAWNLGLNFKANDISAAVALVHLRRFDSIINRRKENAEALTSLLCGIQGAIRLPEFPKESCPFAYPMMINSTDISRNEICRALNERGIETRPMFPCIPTRQPAYRSVAASYDNLLPNSEYLSANGFYVGCHEHLSPQDMEIVARAVIDTVSDARKPRQP